MSLYVALYGEWSSGEVVPVNPATGVRGAAMAFAGGVLDLQASPDRRTLYVLTGSGTVIPVDVATGRRGRPISLPAEGIAEIAVSPDGKTLWGVGNTPGRSHRPELVSASTGSGHAGGPVRLSNTPVALVFSPDGRSLYVAAETCYDEAQPCAQDLFVVATASGRVVKTVTLGTRVQALAVAPDGRTVYVQNGDTSVTSVSTVTWDLESTIRSSRFTLNANAGLPPSNQGVPTLVISPDGRTMYDLNGTGIAVIPLTG